MFEFDIKINDNGYWGGDNMKKLLAIFLILILLSLTGCTKMGDNYSSDYTSTFSKVDITGSEIVSSNETASVNSENVSSNDNSTQVESNQVSNITTSDETSSNITSSDTIVTAPRPEKVTKIYDFNINTTVSEPQKLVFYDPQNGNKLPYCLYLPDDYSSSKKYPVILFLHGAGEIGSDNQLQLNNIRNMFAYNAHYVSQSILICPQTPEWWNLDRDYYGDKKGTLSSAINLLKDIQNKYSCDSNRIYLTGLSMGAFATWDLLENYGDIFAAAVPVCGGGNEMMAERYVDIPIVMYHGTADPTVSFQSSQRTYDAIIAAGGTKALLIPLEGVGHDAWIHAYADRNMFEWLFAQDKSKNDFVKYQETPSFRIADSKGNDVITSDDLFLVDYELKGNTADLEILVNTGGKEKLAAAYTASGGKEFTVYCLSQKICSFTATTAPIDNKILITGVFSADNYRGFYEILKSICF